MKRFFTFTALAILIVASAVFGVFEFKKEMTGIKQDLTDIKKEIAALKPLIEKPPQPVAPPPRPVTGKTGIKGDPFLGSPDSPLVLVEFSDYQCPFCARFFNNTLPLIKKEYIDTGKLRYVFKDFPLDFHKLAQKASEAAHCAGEEGKYWEMHDLLFKNQAKLAEPDLMDHAGKLGLNADAFKKCLADGRFAEGIKKDLEDGRTNSGVTGTPSFVLGKVNEGGEVEGNIIRGARPYEAFKNQIDALLKKGS